MKTRQWGKEKSYAGFAEKVIQRADEMVDDDAHKMPPARYVYATKSTAFPGLIKIGHTGDMVSRLVSLNTGCAPAPHVPVAVAPSVDSARDEKAAHDFFASKRVQGEFFNISEADVKAFFAEHITARYQSEFLERLAVMQEADMQLPVPNIISRGGVITLRLMNRSSSSLVTA
jgi:hypothetical protein